MVFGTLCATRAVAGIADSPLPVLLPGAPTLHRYSVPGAIAGFAVDTFFACTSTDSAPIQAGVELFPAPGGAPINDAVATSLSIAPGATVMFGTSAAVGISIDLTSATLRRRRPGSSLSSPRRTRRPPTDPHPWRDPTARRRRLRTRNGFEITN